MNILSPTGRPMLELSGAQAWRTFTKGDITISLQWLDLRPWGVQSDGPEPVMVLQASARRTHGAGVYVIRQDTAHEYATTRGDPTPHLLGSAFKGAVQMGFYPDKSTVHRILDAVVEAMPDLIRMPSVAPTALHDTRPVHGIEATATMNGKVIQETVL